MADIFMTGSVAVAAANIVLAALLLLVYGGVYLRTKAPFTLALIVFAGAFVAQNLVTVFAYLTMMPVVPEALSPHLFGIGSLEAVGLVAMLWTASR